MLFVTANSRICSFRTAIYTTPDSCYVHVYGTYHSAYYCCSVGGCGFHPFPFGSLEPHPDDLSENRYRSQHGMIRNTSSTWLFISLPTHGMILAVIHCNICSIMFMGFSLYISKHHPFWGTIGGSLYCHICRDANTEARWIACNLQCTQLGAQAGGRSTGNVRLKGYLLLPRA